MPGTVTRQARPGRGPLGRGLLLAGLILGGVLAALWALGLADPLQDRVTEAQRAVQNRLAGAVRAIRAGEAGAVLGLMAICFGYGFLHAVGPGHGKMLIGGYGMARRVGPGRLAGIALVSSLAQAAVAVALVYGFIAVMGWTRERLEAVSETVLDPVGTLAILGIGLWLALRGLRGIARDGAGGAGGAPAGQDHSHGHAHSHDHGQHHDHDHGHDHDHAHVHSEACGCGHSHGPTPDQIAGARDTKAVLALIAGVAIRPCSGALFLLILTWKLGIATAGIMGAFAMGLGTASVTMAVAGAAVWMREGALAALPGAGVARALPVLELLVGAVVVVVAARMLWAGIWAPLPKVRARLEGGKAAG